MTRTKYRQRLFKLARRLDEQLCRTDICNPRYAKQLEMYGSVCKEIGRLLAEAV